jgi:DNA-binding HxlR family transcriptional regulator
VNYESKDVIVLGIIKGGAKKFDQIRKQARVDPEQLNQILENLEEKNLIQVQEKKGFLGKKIEITVTKKGDTELENRVHELEKDWNQMVSLYKSGDKQRLNQYVDDHRSFLPTMMFFGIVDMMMFSMMFGMIGAQMNDYVPAEDMPADMDGDNHGDSGGMDDGGFDVDIGF